MLDIELIKSQFIWIGTDGKKSRLDRVLMDVNWFAKGKWMSRCLHKKNSDHKALLLLAEELD